MELADEYNKPKDIVQNKYESHYKNELLQIHDSDYSKLLFS